MKRIVHCSFDYCKTMKEQILLVVLLFVQINSEIPCVAKIRSSFINHSGGICSITAAMEIVQQ